MRFKTMRDNLEYMAVEQAGPEAVARFEEMLARGESVSMAATLATKSPPRTGVDDRTVMANSRRVSEQFKNEPWMLQQYRNNYRRLTGENLPDDAVVYRSLVRFPGDPTAIVTHKHSLSAVKQAMRERNERVEGDWEIHPESAPPKPQEVRMNAQVMARYKQEYRSLDEWRDVDERDLEEEILHRHAPVVTPDEVMNTPKSIDEAYQKTFAGTPWE